MTRDARNVREIDIGGMPERIYHFLNFLEEVDFRESEFELEALLMALGTELTGVVLNQKKSTDEDYAWIDTVLNGIMCIDETTPVWGLMVSAVRGACLMTIQERMSANVPSFPRWAEYVGDMKNNATDAVLELHRRGIIKRAEEHVVEIDDAALRAVALEGFLGALMSGAMIPERTASMEEVFFNHCSRFIRSMQEVRENGELAGLPMNYRGALSLMAVSLAQLEMGQIDIDGIKSAVSKHFDEQVPIDEDTPGDMLLAAVIKGAMLVAVEKTFPEDFALMVEMHDSIHRHSLKALIQLVARTAGPVYAQSWAVDLTNPREFSLAHCEYFENDDSDTFVRDIRPLGAAVRSIVRAEGAETLAEAIESLHESDDPQRNRLAKLFGGLLRGAPLDS